LNVWSIVNTGRSATSEPRTAVMVVEDEVLLRMMIADELRHSDLQVIECGNADEALDVLHSGTPVSAVLTDLRMPGSLDGVKLAKAVHDEFPDMRVFLTSSCAPPLDDAPYEGFFQNPYDPRVVVRTIKSTLR
jgi:two-component system, response regulator PdtaR